MSCCVASPHASRCSLATWDQPRPGWLSASSRSRQLLPPETRTVLGDDSHQSTIFSAMKRHCCCQQCLATGWQGSGNGTGPCCTKRITETKQFWQVWNLRTLPGRYENYKCQAACRRDGSSLCLCAPRWTRWKYRRWVSTSGLKTDTWLKSSSQSGSRQCHTEQKTYLLLSGGYFLSVKHNK